MIDVSRTEIVEGIAAAGELVALVAAPAEGKSALAVALSVAVAEARPFLGRAVQRGAVFYLAAERSQEVVRRLRAIAGGDPAIYVSSGRPALASQSDVEDVLAALRDISIATREVVRLVVLDTAARCLRGLDENSARDIGIAIEALARIADAAPQATILLVHHTTKDGSEMRGSSALLGAVDVELKVQRRAGERYIEVTKANSIPEGQRLPFALEPRSVVGGSIVAAVPVATRSPAGPGDAPSRGRPPRDAADALDVLVSIAPATIEAWRNAVMARWSDRKRGTARQAFSKAREILIQRGLIVIDGESVSVSDASARASASISADGAKASARGVSAPPSIGGGADVADDADSRSSRDVP